MTIAETPGAPQGAAEQVINVQWWAGTVQPGEAVPVQAGEPTQPLPSVAVQAAEAPAADPETYSRRLAGKIGNVALNVAATVAVAVDLPVVFESAWGVMTAAAAQTHNPYLAAGLVTAGTLLIEGGAALGTARLMAQKSGSWVMRKTHAAAAGIGLKAKAETSLPTDVAVSFAFGTPAMLASKQVFNPERTEQENRRRGLVTAGINTSIAAFVNLAVAEGAVDITPAKVTAAVVAVAGLFAARGQVKKRLHRRDEAHVQEAKDVEIRKTIPATPDYDLTQEQCDVVERDLVNMVLKTHGRTVGAVWIESGHPAANLLRTEEKRALPEANTPALFAEYEDASMFLAMVDTRRGSKGKVIRGTRVTGRPLVDTGQPREHSVVRDGGTDMAMIRDMITDGELTGLEIAWYYEQHGIDLANSVSIETNFKIHSAPKRLGMVAMADVAHLAMYHHAFGDRHNQSVAVFAHINQATRSSLGRLGLTIEEVAGREDLQTPAGKGSVDRYDAKYHPVVLPNKGRTRRILGAVQAFAPPRIILTAPQRTVLSA